MAKLKKSAVKSSAAAKRGGPRKGPIEDVATSILSDPANQKAVFSFLWNLIQGLFKKKEPVPALPPVVVVPVPNPGSVTPPDLIDDVIPAPPAADRVVTSVKLTLAGGQLNRQRFPNAPNGGLLDMSYLKQVQAGKMALNYGSKFWLDLTAYDQNGREFLPGDVIAYNLCYQTEHHAGDAYIKGHGGTAQRPTDGYETNDTNEIGNGISSWVATLGFKHQMKAHGEGEFRCSGSVGGVEAGNPFTIRVS